MSMRYFRFALAVVAGLCVLLLTLVFPPAASGQGPSGQAIEKIIQAQERHTERLMAIEGIVGTAAGEDAVIVLVKDDEAAKKVPKKLDDVPVKVNVSGEIRALSATDRYDRPVPIGVSTGHPDITAGTIGCRVKDGSGNIFALSNNHVYANENKATIGDNVLQPGPYDGGTNPADAIGTLYDFEPIEFGLTRPNVIDAAIALCTTGTLGTATLPDGYGAPEPQTVQAAVGLAVMKYGRTTGQTYGAVTGVNASVWVVYSSGIARFNKQIIVESTGAFSLGGDSGSLIVTDPGRNPVGLLFAGNESGSLTVANPIDLVLQRFGVTVEGAAPPPVTDIAVTGVSAPSPVVKGDVVDVSVTVENVGNQDVITNVHITLNDLTDGVAIGMPQTIGGLAVGASSTLHFSWDTSSASLGTHTLEGSHDYSDDEPANNSKTTNVLVQEAPVGVTVTAIVPSTMKAGTTAAVTITGSGFVAGAKVTFEGGGGRSPKASKVKVQDSSTITANVSTKAVSPSVWDVRVTNSDGSTGVLPGGFTVTP